MGDYEWLEDACDRLREVGLDDAAKCLEELPALKADLLALVDVAEGELLRRWDESRRPMTYNETLADPHWGPILVDIARARGETLEDAYRRLAPSYHEPPLDLSPESSE